jgi:hypoxanthine phosphoribosyltransferase
MSDAPSRPSLPSRVTEVVLDRHRIAARVAELGRSISEAYAGKDLLVVGVLKGAFVFLADLVREIDVPLRVDFVKASSYGEGMTSSGSVRLIHELAEDPAGRHVLVVEDIVDTGHTMSFLLEYLRGHGPASLEVCALFDKPSARVVSVDARWVGFPIPAGFIVGYGMDHAEWYRNLPDISLAEPIPVAPRTATEVEPS